MRLINTIDFKTEEFLGDDIPQYVILSHTWGEEEVTYQDIVTGTGKEKAGFEKVRGCCVRASKDGYRYAWIDTCCIDKSSSAELSEAINSMYQWYQKSQICYVYLDVVLTGTGAESKAAFLESRWFTRGWTLQELLAPSIVEFYDKNWFNYGTRSSLEDVIERRTGIKNSILKGADLSTCSIAERMTWAAERRTTRIEDEAYCLIGIFEVNMPLLYGEGPRAFIRLQEEILKRSEDQTIFAWPGKPREQHEQSASPLTGLLAVSPAEFGDWQDMTCSNLIPVRLAELPMTSGYRFSKDVLKAFGSDLSGTVPATISSRGIHLSLLIEQSSSYTATVAFLCRTVENRGLVCIKLNKLQDGRYARIRDSVPCLQSLDDLQPFSLMNIYAAPSMSEISVPIRTAPYAIFKVDTATSRKSPLDIAVMWRYGKRCHSHSVTFTPNPHCIAGVVLLKYQAMSSFLVAFGLSRGMPWCTIVEWWSTPNLGANEETLAEAVYQKFSNKTVFSSYNDRALQVIRAGEELNISARRQGFEGPPQYELSITLKRQGDDEDVD
jgi:hypothetical protein